MDLHLNPSDLRLELLLPEFIVAGTALGVILAEVLSPRGRRAVIAPIFAALGLVAALAVLVLMRPDGAALPLFRGDTDRCRPGGVALRRVRAPVRAPSSWQEAR